MLLDQPQGTPSSPVVSKLCQCANRFRFTTEQVGPRCRIRMRAGRHFFALRALNFTKRWRGRQPYAEPEEPLGMGRQAVPDCLTIGGGEGASKVDGLGGDFRPVSPIAAQLTSAACKTGPEGTQAPDRDIIRAICVTWRTTAGPGKRDGALSFRRQSKNSSCFKWTGLTQLQRCNSGRGRDRHRLDAQARAAVPSGEGRAGRFPERATVPLIGRIMHVSSEMFRALRPGRNASP